MEKENVTGNAFPSDVVVVVFGVWVLGSGECFVFFWGGDSQIFGGVAVCLKR